MSQGTGAAFVTRKPTSPAVSGLPLHTSRLGGGRRATAGSSISGSVGSSLNVVGRVVLPSSKLSRVPGTGSMAHLTSAATRTKTPPVTASGSVLHTAEVSSTTTSITAKHLGQLVTIAGVQTGTLRYFGPTDFEEGLWCGIELESPVGKNNGTVKGTKYFACAENYGIFAPVYKVTLQCEVDSFKQFVTSKHSRKSCGPIVINGKQAEAESPVEPGPPPSSPVITSTTSVAGICSQQTPFASKGPNKRPKPEGGPIAGTVGNENSPQVISSAVELKRRRLDLSQRSWSASAGAVKYSKFRAGQFGVKLPSFSQVNLRDEMEDSCHFDDSPLFTPPKSFAEFAVERSQRRHMYDSTPKLVEGVLSPPVQTAPLTPRQTCSEFDREDDFSQDDMQIVPIRPEGGEDAPPTDFDNNSPHFSAEPLTFVVYSDEKPQRPKTLLGLASTGVSSEDSSEQGGILGVSTPEFITGDGTSSALSIPTEGGSCCGSSEDVSSSDGPLLENESSLGLLTPSQLQEWNSFNGNEDDDDLYKHLRSPSVDELEDFEEEEDRTVDQDLMEERLRAEEMRLQEQEGVGTVKASCEAGGLNPPLSSVPEQPEEPSSLEDTPIDPPPPSPTKKGASNESFLDETNTSSVTIVPPAASGEDGPASLRESGYCGGSDPMTDSDFNTESDAEPGESDEVRQKHREARVIDGALYTVSSSHSSHSSKDSGCANMMATSSASITTSSTTSVSVSEMESSGFYSDSTSASGSSGSSGRRAWRHLSSDCDDQKSSKAVGQVDEVYAEDSVRDEDELPFERTLIANEEKDSNTSSFSNGASSPNAPQAPGQLGCPKESVHSSPKKVVKKTLPVSKSDHTGNVIGYLRSSKQKVRSQSVNCIASLAPNTESIAKDLHKLKSSGTGAAGGLKDTTNKTRVTPANPVSVASKTGHQQQLSSSGVSGPGVLRRSSQSSSIVNAASPARKSLTSNTSVSSTTSKPKVGVKLGLDKLSRGRKDLHGGSTRSLASTGTTGGGSPASVRRIVKEPTPGAVPKKWEAVMNKIAESKQSHAKIDVSHVKSKVFNSFKAPSTAVSSSISKTQKTVILVKDKENSAPVPTANGSGVVCPNSGPAHPFSSRSSTSSDFSNDDQPTPRPSRVHPHSKHRAKKDASKSSSTATATATTTNNNNNPVHRQISDLSTASEHSKGTDQISTKRSTTNNKNNKNLNTEGGSSSSSTITKVSASSLGKGIKPPSKQVGVGSSSGLAKKKDITGNAKVTSTNNKSGGVTLGTGKGLQQQGSQGKTSSSTSGGPRDRNRNAPATKTSAVVVVPSTQDNHPTTQVFIDNVKSGSDKVNSNNNAKASGRKNSSVSVLSQDQQTSKEFAKVVSELEERLQSLTKDSEAEKQASQSKISCLELTRDALSVVIQQQISQGSVRENQLQQEIVNYIEQIRNNAILFHDKCKDLENLQTELDRERECHKEELAEVNKEHAKLVETLVKDHSQALADAKKESDEVIGKIRKEHVEEIEKLKEGFRLEVEELGKKHKEVLNAHRKLSPHDLMVKEIQSLEVVLEMRNDELRSLRTDLVNYKATIEELKDSQELVRTLHANKEDLNAQMDKSRKDKAVLQERIQELESHLTVVECEKSDLSRKYEQVCFKYQSRKEAGGGDLSSSLDDLNS